MTDTPAPAPTNRPAPVAGAIGFLAILHDPAGASGGYLVTNSWGRPLEFRLTTAVQPTRVQQVLYGHTLADYLHGEVIGRALVEKTSILPGLIIADSLSMLGLRAHAGVPVVALAADGGSHPDVFPIPHARSPVPFWVPKKFAADRELIEARLDLIDPAVDPAEPFTRVREAVTEARKMGVTTRGAA